MGTTDGRNRDYDNYPIRAYKVVCWFTTNGASDPTEFAGNVEMVRRLTSTGGEEFYRITTLAPKEEKRRVVHAACTVLSDLDGGDDFQGEVPLDVSSTPSIPVQMPSGTPAAAAAEFDVVVRNGATRALTNQVPAGRHVSVEILFDKSARL